MTDWSDDDTSASLTLALIVLEVSHAGAIVVARFNRFMIEVVFEQNADAFAPRVLADRIDDSIAVGTRLNASYTSTRFDCQQLCREQPSSASHPQLA